MKKQTQIKVKKRDPRIVHTYYLTCPICKTEIKGISEKHTIVNFRMHFKNKHPKEKLDKHLFKEGD